MRLEVSQPREGTTLIVDEFRTASYTITPVKNAENMSVVMKTGQSGEEVIAKFDFRTLRADRFWLRGKELEISKYLEKKAFSSTRTFTTAQGRTYSWAPAGVSSLVLRNNGGWEIGRSHNASRGIMGKEKHGAYIEIDDYDDLFKDLDELVITFAYIKERERRDRGA